MHSTARTDRLLTVCLLGIALGACSGVIGSMIGLSVGPGMMITLFAVMFAGTLPVLLRKDLVYGFYYCFLFIYTFFGQIAYVYFPDKLASRGFFYGSALFGPYWLFTVLTFVATFVLFMALRSRRSDSARPWIVIERIGSRTRVLLFYYAVGAVDLIVLYYALTRYSDLSYYTQDILKGDKIFIYALYLCALAVLALYHKVCTAAAHSISRPLDAGLFAATLILYLTVTTRAGQRGEVLTTFLGLGVCSYLCTPPRRRLITLWKLTMAAFVVIIFLNAIRQLRGDVLSLPSTVAEILRSPSQYLLWPTLESVTFQDYLSPSLTLATSMYYDFIQAGEVVRSNLVNLLVLVDYPTLGARLSRLVDPAGWAGYGYYIFTEGYNMCGWWGILYNAVVFNVGMLLWSRLNHTGDRGLDTFMTSVMCACVLSIVRGQSFFFIKNLYFTFLPAAILYALGTGAALRIGGRRIL